jgi:hypothetical protein
METKRPFARVASWSALWFATAALILLLLVIVTAAKPPAAVQPSAFALAIPSLLALGVFACLLTAFGCGVIALCGVRKHGRNGILVPALCGLGLAVAMLVPVLWVGFAQHNNQVKAREGTPPVVAPAPNR